MKKTEFELKKALSFKANVLAYARENNISFLEAKLKFENKYLTVFRSLPKHFTEVKSQMVY